MMILANSPSEKEARVIKHSISAIPNPCREYCELVSWVGFESLLLSICVRVRFLEVPCKEISHVSHQHQLTSVGFNLTCLGGGCSFCRKTSDCSSRLEEQKRPGEEEWHLLHCGSW